jgi:hypothetical protein
MNKRQAKKLIPRGDYCYDIIARVKENIKVKCCPFWGRNPEKHAQESGFCTLFNFKDWDTIGFGLLWDQVKECGLREYKYHG